MALLLLDTDAAGSLYWDMTCQLDGREYVMEFWWSSRESAWYLSLYDQDETPLAEFIRLVVSFDLLRRWRSDPRIPTGLLVLVDGSGFDADVATDTDLGERCKLYYFTADDADLIAARAA